MDATAGLGLFAMLLLAAGLAAFAWQWPARYRQSYPLLSRACVAAMAGLLGASVALPALGVPIWTFFAAATLNVFSFALLWLPRLRRSISRE
jgi:hypothetical protein